MIEILDSREATAEEIENEKKNREAVSGSSNLKITNIEKGNDESSENKLELSDKELQDIIKKSEDEYKSIKADNKTNWVSLAIGLVIAIIVIVFVRNIASGSNTTSNTLSERVESQDIVIDTPDIDEGGN